MIELTDYQLSYLCSLVINDQKNHEPINKVLAVLKAEIDKRDGDNTDEN